MAKRYAKAQTGELLSADRWPAHLEMIQDIAPSSRQPTTFVTRFIDAETFNRCLVIKSPRFFWYRCN
jgi:hypothetical protein